MTWTLYFVGMPFAAVAMVLWLRRINNPDPCDAEAVIGVAVCWPIALAVFVAWLIYTGLTRFIGAFLPKGDA